MKTMQTQAMSVAIFSILIAFQSSGFAGELVEDFSDGAVFDGDPIQWIRAPCCPGTFTPVDDGGIEVKNEISAAAVASQEVFVGDTTVRVHGSFRQSFASDHMVALVDPHVFAVRD